MSVIGMKGPLKTASIAHLLRPACALSLPLPRGLCASVTPSVSLPHYPQPLGSAGLDSLRELSKQLACGIAEDCRDIAISSTEVMI